MRVRSWAQVTVWGLPLLDVSVAVLLSVAAIGTVARTDGVGPAHRWIGAVCVLAMTVPVAWSRRAPVAASAVLAAGAVFNAVAIGPMVRCGAALPAVFFAGFMVGWRCGRRDAAVGVVLCAVNVLAQTISDPQLGVSQFPLMTTLLCVFVAMGRVMRGHSAAVESLQRQTAELRRRRERTARLAALADRARVSADLEDTLHAYVRRITAAALAGQASVGRDGEQTVAQLTAVEHEGRDALQQLRAILGSLDGEPPASPPPTLADLPTLLARATSAEVCVGVEGSARTLPAGLELTACRVAEHLVTAVADSPQARADVVVLYTPESLVLELSGPEAQDVELAPVLAAARLRASLHGGTVDGHYQAGRCRASAAIPLVSAHA